MAKRDFPFPRRQKLDQPQKNEPKPVTPPAMNEFTDSCHPGRILVGLHKQWTEGLFLDMTISVNDVSVRAHKSVLSAFSRYFEALFNCDMRDAGCDEISLSDIHVSGTALRLLIEFAYSGSLYITPENVQDLLCAANFLCIDTVISACATYLQNNLSLENCLDVLELAVSLDQLELQRNIESFMILHFEEFVKQEIFLKMPVERLVSLLEKDELIVTQNGFCISEVEQEEKILRLIFRFVEAKPEVNHEHLPMLLSRCVRLMLLPSSVLEVLELSNWIKSSVDSLKLVSRVLSSDVSSEEEISWKHPRLHVAQYEKTRELGNTTVVRSETSTDPFDDGHLVHDGQNLFVTGMKIYTRTWDSHVIVGGIEVFYNIGKSVLHGTAGYEDGGEDGEFHLDVGERITSIIIRAGWMIDQLTFTTNRGKVYGPFGGNGGNEHHLRCPYDGAYLAYITGIVVVNYSQTAVRQLQFVWGFRKHSS